VGRHTAESLNKTFHSPPPKSLDQPFSLHPLHHPPQSQWVTLNSTTLPSTPSERSPYVSSALLLPTMPRFAELSLSSGSTKLPHNAQSLNVHRRRSTADRDMNCIGRCDVPGKLRPPRCAHGHGASCPHSLQQIHDLQPQEPRLGQPRSFRSLVRISLYKIFLAAHAGEQAGDAVTSEARSCISAHDRKTKFFWRGKIGGETWDVD
jgi:hypothetical protein